MSYLTYHGFIFFVAQLLLVGQGVLIIEASRSHSDTPHLVGLLCTSYRPYEETKHSQQRNIHAPGGFEHTSPRSGRSQNHALDCAVTGVGWLNIDTTFIQHIPFLHIFAVWQILRNVIKGTNSKNRFSQLASKTYYQN
jgi:hypothetical protein